MKKLSHVVDEKDLLEQMQQKNERALRQFYVQYYRSVVGYINNKIHNYEKSEELAQETFIDLVEALRDFRRESSLKTFVFTIARNKTIDYFRKKKVKKILFSALPQHVVESISSVVMDEDLERRELSQKIQKTISRLPNDYRVVLRLKYMDGERVKIIAKKLMLNFKTTESLIFRARKAFIKLFLVE